MKFRTFFYFAVLLYCANSFKFGQHLSLRPTTTKYSFAIDKSPDNLNSLDLNDVFYEYHGWNTSKRLLYDENKRKFIPLHQSQEHSGIAFLKQLFLNCFIPSGDLTPDYYNYAFWRSIQRFISATNNVIGSSAMLLALGVKQKNLGIGATVIWILKDVLGKFSRIFWASTNGRRFDGDAKKWRFRSALLFALGNGLEVLTYIFPSLFFISAATGNALKQIAMLTYSATRNTM
jgi:hypothetical protein